MLLGVGGVIQPKAMAVLTCSQHSVKAQFDTNLRYNMDRVKYGCPVGSQQVSIHRTES